MHTTSCLACVCLACDFAMISVSEQVLDLEFLAAYSGRFIPVYFSKLRRAIGQSDARTVGWAKPAGTSSRGRAHQSQIHVQTRGGHAPSAFALRASADLKPAVARAASEGGSALSPPYAGNLRRQWSAMSMPRQNHTRSKPRICSSSL